LRSDQVQTLVTNMATFAEPQVLTATTAPALQAAAALWTFA
jgi:hypothetical protein